MIDPRPPTVVLDGGLATSLQPLGLAVATPVDDWVRDRPDDVRAVQARFAAAGARILLASTFRTLPHLRADWADIADRAVAIARSAAGEAEVWASIGPASTAERRWVSSDSPGWAALARRCEAAGAQGFALETFIDAAECVAAVATIRAATALPIAACLCPRDDGRLFDGSDPSGAVAALREAGATWVGFNCGTGPASIEAAVALAPGADWAKPSSGGLPAEEVVAALLRLAGRCHFVGGCCGVDAEMIAKLATGVRASRRETA